MRCFNLMTIHNIMQGTSGHQGRHALWSPICKFQRHSWMHRRRRTQPQGCSWRTQQGSTKGDPRNPTTPQDLAEEEGCAGRKGLRTEYGLQQQRQKRKTLRSHKIIRELPLSGPLGLEKILSLQGWFLGTSPGASRTKNGSFANRGQGVRGWCRSSETQSGMQESSLKPPCPIGAVGPGGQGGAVGPGGRRVGPAAGRRRRASWAQWAPWPPCIVFIQLLYILSIVICFHFIYGNRWKG